MVASRLLPGDEFFSEGPQCTYCQAAIQKAHIDMGEKLLYPILLVHPFNGHSQS
jgi:hypothetical protein